MSATTPTWNGSSDFEEQPGSPALVWDVNKLTITRTWEGTVSACESYDAYTDTSWGSIISGVSVRIVHLDRQPMAGGKMKLVIRGETGDSGPTSDPTAPTYENEWVEVDKALVTHPIFKTGGTYELTEADLAALERWQSEDQFSWKQQYSYKVETTIPPTAPPDGYSPNILPNTPITIGTMNYDVYTLSANAQVAAAKMLKGVTTWTAYAPVVRETVTTTNLPTSNPCGRIEPPPIDATAPEGYTYIRSAQRGTKTGRYGQWNQQREWQGAEDVDPDLYPTP